MYKIVDKISVHTSKVSGMVVVLLMSESHFLSSEIYHTQKSFLGETSRSGTYVQALAQ